MAGGHRAGTAPSTGYKFEDDVQLIFGTDSDGAVKFTSADALLDVTGLTWRWSLNKGLKLRADSSAVGQTSGQIARLIELTMTTDRDRPWISWVDHNGVHRAALGYHDTTAAPESAVHQDFEIKTNGTTPTDMVTRLRIGAGANLGTVSLPATSSVQIEPYETSLNQLLEYQVRSQYSGSTTASVKIGSYGAYLDGSENTVLQFEPLPVTATKDARIRSFRNVTTSGVRDHIYFRGDGSGTTAVTINAGTGRIAFDSGTGFLLTFAHSITAARTVTFPDAAITVAGLGLAQTWTAVQTFQSTPAMDAIAERTATAGVTIDGLLLKDGGIGAAASHTGLQTFITGAATDSIAERTAAAGVTIDGLLLKDSIVAASGANLGFFGIGPVARPTAYTQTYATADKTHANFTSADLAAFDGGLVGFADSAERDNIRTQFNALRADVADLKQLVNSVIDDLQALGLLQ